MVLSKAFASLHRSKLLTNCAPTPLGHSPNEQRTKTVAERKGWPMRNQVRRRPNALKHGAYSQELILPGENQAAFKKLHQALMAHYRPGCPLEEDCVRSLTRATKA